MILALGLFLVMLVQGMTLHPRDLWPQSLRVAVVFVLLRMAVLPVLALLSGWMFDLSLSGNLALALTALAPPSVGVIALVTLTGGAVPLSLMLIAAGTVMSVAAWSALGVIQIGVGSQTDGLWLLQELLLWVALPFVLGMTLRAFGVTAGPVPAMLASVITGLMILLALLGGSGTDTWAMLQAVLVFALAVAAASALAGRLMRLRGDEALSLNLTMLVAAVVMPIGLGARMGSPDLGFAAALYGVVGYLIAFALMAARMRHRA